MELKDYMKEHNDILEKALDKYFSKVDYPKVIAEGIKYAVLNGGKRIRPNLLFMVLDMFDTDISKGMATACAIEMIHSYSLVHDDLPALDNDNYRRGKLTTHKKFGEANGILIGDSLLTYAFYVLTEMNNEVLPYDKIFKIIRKTSEYAGVAGMIGGQTVDVESEGKKVDLKTLKYIHEHKTGKMLKLPVECGCIISDVSSEDYKALEKYAEYIGLAFQIKDDILDIEGDFEKLGKPIGSDLELDKSTYPAIMGMDKSKKLLDDTIESAKTILLGRFGEKKAHMLLKLAEFIEKRDK